MTIESLIGTIATRWGLELGVGRGLISCLSRKISQLVVQKTPKIISIVVLLYVVVSK